jgi:hypothetical protein
MFMMISIGNEKSLNRDSILGKERMAMRNATEN